MLLHFQKSLIASLLKYVPGFLIFVGSLKLIVFYSFFKLRIVEYLDFTEVLISFLDNVISFVFFVLFPMAVALSFWGKGLGKANQEEFDRLTSLPIGKRFWIDLKSNGVSVFLGLMVFVIAVYRNVWSSQILALLLFVPGVFLIDIIIREIRIAYKKQYDYVIPATYINVFTIANLFIIIVIQQTLNEVTSIKTDLKYFGTKVYLDDEFIVSDSSITYVGQTKNYLFMYNLKQDESIVVPKSEVKKIVIKRK